MHTADELTMLIISAFVEFTYLYMMVGVSLQGEG